MICTARVNKRFIIFTGTPQGPWDALARTAGVLSTRPSCTRSLPYSLITWLLGSCLLLVSAVSQAWDVN